MTTPSQPIAPAATATAAAEATPALPDVSGVRFDDFDLSDEVLEGVADAGYAIPTPVQAHAISPVLEGRDVVVQARTGTGKTAAFGLPLLELVDPLRPGVQALVLTPVRELSQQVAAEINKLGRFTDVRAVSVHGGEAIGRQLRALEEGARIVVGTPGRVLDHLRRGTLSTRRVRYFVLDEADEMLSMGFAKELGEILRYLPERRQTCLFSATFPEVVERLVKRHVHDPVRIALAEDMQMVGQVEHHYYIAPRIQKYEYLLAVLDAEGIESAIVFCNRKDETRTVAGVLRRAGYHALPINADLAQAERDEVMQSIKRGDLTVLVATDIAARGIDISDLAHVVNYSTPESPEQYVHRTGRTGRLGKAGTAVTLVSAQELSSLKAIESLKTFKMQEKRLPPDEVIMAHRVDRLMHDLQRLAALRSPEDRVRGEREDWTRVAERLQQDPESRQVLYLLLQSFFEGVKKNVAGAAKGTAVEEMAGEFESSSPARPAPPPRRSSEGGRRPSRPRTRR